MELPDRVQPSRNGTAVGQGPAQTLGQEARARTRRRAVDDRQEAAPLLARLRARLPRVGLAALAMGTFLFWVVRFVPDLGETGLLLDILALLVISGAGAAVFAVAATLLRAYGLADVKDAFRKS